MAIYAIGSEDEQCVKNGSVACTVDTAQTGARRTAYARNSLKVTSNTSTDGWERVFNGTPSLFWFTVRMGWSTNGNNNTSPSDLIAFKDSTVRRLIITNNMLSGTTGKPAQWRLSKRDASNATTVLQTSTTLQSMNNNTGHSKVDIFVNYAVAGQVIVWVDGAKVLDYSGDVTTNSATTLGSAVMGTMEQNTGSSFYWSELACTSFDTRGLSVCTVPLAALGNTHNFSGAATDVNESTLDDTTLNSTGNANDIQEFTITSSGITGNPGIRALAICARAQKGGSGPTQIQSVIRTGGTDYVGSTKALPAAFGLIEDIIELNPATGLPFLYSDLTAAGFNVGIKAIT